MDKFEAAYYVIGPRGAGTTLHQDFLDTSFWNAAVVNWVALCLVCTHVCACQQGRHQAPGDRVAPYRSRVFVWLTLRTACLGERREALGPAAARTWAAISIQLKLRHPCGGVGMGAEGGGDQCTDNPHFYHI